MNTLRDAAQQALEQDEPVEPVAWMCPDDPERETAFSWEAGHCDDCGKQRSPLYTAPPQHKPLTDEKILKILRSLDADTERLPPGLISFARAIERAHGIGEEE